jgi:hypothetical protein
LAAQAIFSDNKNPYHPAFLDGFPNIRALQGIIPAGEPPLKAAEKNAYGDDSKEPCMNEE